MILHLKQSKDAKLEKEFNGINLKENSKLKWLFWTLTLEITLSWIETVVSKLLKNNNYLKHYYFGSQCYKVFGQKFSLYWD